MKRNYITYVCTFIVCTLLFILIGGFDTSTVKPPSDKTDVNATVADKDNVPSTEATTEAPSTEPPTEETEPVVNSVTVNLVAVGDMLLHGGIHNSALQPDGTYDYTHVFAHTKDRIQAADIAVANQEIILGGTELGISSYPVFNSTQEYGDYLADAGFNVILHASNHTLDAGFKGVDNTINFWKTKHPDVTFLGINESEQASTEIKVVEVEGIKIAMLNYTYGLNGFNLPADKPYLVNLMDEEHKPSIEKDLKKARELADFVIVYPHWGSEYVLDKTNEQLKWAQFFADNGADLIIGTHPHVIEPVEWITAADGREVLVYYSLGNFISIQYYHYAMLGGFAEVTITKDEIGTYISNHDMDFVVTHYTAGRTEMTTYFLSDYTDELASRHAILTEPYEGRFAETYKTANGPYPFTVAGLRDLAKKVCPQFFE